MDRQALAEAILQLENGTAPPLADAELAHALGIHLKPYIDQLNSDAEALALSGEDKQPGQSRKAPPPSVDLSDTSAEVTALPPREQARLIFMDRFITLEKHEEILNCEFSNQDFETYNKLFEEFISFLLHVPPIEKTFEANDIPKLQKLFSSYVLLFRSPITGSAAGDHTATNLDALRDRFPAYFYKRKKIWYEHLDFFHDPIDQPQWVLCDSSMLNCTLRRPQRRLSSYAKTWTFPPDLVRQKTVLEDIYDRIICGEALEEHLFAGDYNHCTATTYSKSKRHPQRLVFTVQREQQISLHGKNGIPHWRASRRLWPGVLPSLRYPA
jgi:hypothetical protein